MFKFTFLLIHIRRRTPGGATLQSRSMGTRVGPERFGDKIKLIPLLSTALRY